MREHERGVRLGFIKAVKLAFKNYANFRGRTTRSEFWWFSLFIVITSVAIFIISEVGIATSADPQLWNTLAQVGTIMTIVWFLATILPVSAIWFRRLHDSNKSGWWYSLTVASSIGGFVLVALSALQNEILFRAGMAFGLASGIGGIVLLVFALLPSTHGPNRYGEMAADTDMA
jgi:uncharacterized membrane protein YhaH (DUF805 family)